MKSSVKGNVLKLSWVSLGLYALIGGFFAVATMPISAAQGAACFTNKTTTDGLGNDVLWGVYADGSTVYAATTGGLSISTDSGDSFTNKTTTDGLGSNDVYGVYAVGSTVYAATSGGLSISTDSGDNFTNKTTTDGLADDIVNDVYAIGSTIYAATEGGLSISTDSGDNFTNKTTADGLGSNFVDGVYVDGSTVYAATRGGLSISTDSGDNFTNKTTADGLGNDSGVAKLKVYAVGSTVYAAGNGLSISTDSGANFTSRTKEDDGLGGNDVYGVYAVGSTVYAATSGGLSISTDSGDNFTNKTTTDGVGSNDVYGVYVDGSTVYAATTGGLSISTNCVSSSATVSSASPGVPGIFLTVNEVLVGTPVDGAPVYFGADAIQPNSTYSLSVQSVMNSALTRTVLATATVNSRGHLEERFELPALNPGTYKIVMTGTHRMGHLLVLTNYLTVDANGGIVSVSPESQQPFLN